MPTSQILIICVTVAICFIAFAYGCTEKIKSDNSTLKSLYETCSANNKSIVKGPNYEYQCI